MQSANYFTWTQQKQDRGRFGSATLPHFVFMLYATAFGCVDCFSQRPFATDHSYLVMVSECGLHSAVNSTASCEFEERNWNGNAADVGAVIKLLKITVSLKNAMSRTYSQRPFASAEQRQWCESNYVKLLWIASWVFLYLFRRMLCGLLIHYLRIRRALSVVSLIISLIALRFDFCLHGIIPLTFARMLPFWYIKPTFPLHFKTIC